MKRKWSIASLLLTLSILLYTSIWLVACSAPDTATSPKVSQSNEGGGNPSIEVRSIGEGDDCTLVVIGAGFTTNESGITVSRDGEVIADNIPADDSGGWSVGIDRSCSEAEVRHVYDAWGDITRASAVRDFTVGTGQEKVADQTGKESQTNIPEPEKPQPEVITPPEIAEASGRIAFECLRGRVFVMNVDGTRQECLADGFISTSKCAWSADGQKIAFSARYESEKRDQIYVMNADGSNLKRLTNNDSFNSWGPAWSPDGKRIAFVYGSRWTPGEIYIMNAEGSSQSKVSDIRVLGPLSWSPDGQKITFAMGDSYNKQVYIMNVDGSERVNLTHNYTDNWGPVWSPDGKRIAFVSEVENISQIYVMNTDGSNLKRLTNNRGRHSWGPTWSPDGIKNRICAQEFGQ